jgi:hypothetical protein
MTPAKFEPALPTNERPQTHALELAANGTSFVKIPSLKCFVFQKICFLSLQLLATVINLKENMF